MNDPNYPPQGDPTSGAQNPDSDPQPGQSTEPDAAQAAQPTEADSPDAAQDAQPTESEPYQPKHKPLENAGLDQEAAEEQRQAELTEQREEHNARTGGGEYEDSQDQA